MSNHPAMIFETKSRRVSCTIRVELGIFIQSTPNELSDFLSIRARITEDKIILASQAAMLDPSFADAYLGWGFCLVSVKRYEEAIPPLRTAERLTPGNP